MMLSNCGAGEDSWESLGQQADQPVNPKGTPNPEFHCKDWYWSWSWNSNTLATWCKEPIHWKRLMLRKTEGKRRRGWQRLRWLVRITNSMDMNLSWLWKIVKDRGAWLPAAHGITIRRTWLSNWTPPPPSKGFLMPWSHQEFGRKQILWDKTPSLPCTAWDSYYTSNLTFLISKLA